MTNATGHSAQADVNSQPNQCTNSPLMRGEQRTRPGTLAAGLVHVASITDGERWKGDGFHTRNGCVVCEGKYHETPRCPCYQNSEHTPAPSTSAVPLPGRRRVAEITYVRYGAIADRQRMSAPDARSHGIWPEQGRDGPIVRTQTTPEAKRTALTTRNDSAP